MSSLRTKAVVAIFTIVALTFGPYSALAQNTWTPPTQAPTGGNVPAPVNIGPLDQKKTGGLSIRGTFQSLSLSRLTGSTILQPDTNNTGFLVNFLRAYNYNDVYFGDSNSFNLSGQITPVDLSVFGRLRYEQADTNGNPVQGVAGNVLVSDAQGFASWADPSTISGGGGADARLPNGTLQGDTLYWDTATSKWKVATNVVINPASNIAFRVIGTAGDFGVLSDGRASADKLTINQELRINLDNSPGAIAGQVLRLMPDGLARWTDALPAGGNTGDTLVWNGTSWVTTNVNNGANLPNGVSVGDTIRWTGTTWDKTSLFQVGTQAQPNAVKTDGVNTSSISLTTNSNAGSNLTLFSPTIRLLGSPVQTGDILTAVDSTGKIAWADPATVGVGGALPPGTDNYTLRYNADLPGWEQTDRITIDDDDDTIYIGTASPTSNIYLSNSDTDSSVTGRFLSSGDGFGKVNWNRNFVYEDIPYGQNQHIDSINVLASEDSDRVTAFANYGAYTYLKNDLQVDGPSTFNGPVVVDDNSPLTVNGGDVNINNDGRLFIENLPGQINTNNLVPVCWDTQTHRISKCTAYAPDPGGFENNDTPMTVTYGPGDNNQHITFTEDTNLDITWCGGGGGGGSGGLGAPILDNNSEFVNGYGAGGGGGGAAAECHSVNRDFSAGQVLSWNIGESGQGGLGAGIQIGGSSNSNIITVINPEDGGDGEPTYLLLNGSQTETIAYGGFGGKKGCSNFEIGSGSTCDMYHGYGGTIGGSGGNISLSLSSSWHNGEPGKGPAFPGCNSCGGSGGDGESQNGANPSNAQGSGGGDGGGGVIVGNNPITIYNGFNGHDGVLPGSGGGGGGGSFGRIANSYNGSTSSGAGGDGAEGFVRITGPANILNGSAQVNEVVYNTPGTYLFDLANLPDNQTIINVELWGGGGGGGGLQYNTSTPGTFKAGGGGAGSYVKLVWDLAATLSASELNCINGPSTNCNDVGITVGAGGSLGVSAITPNPVTGQTSGGTSRICFGNGGGICAVDGNSDGSPDNLGGNPAFQAPGGNAGSSTLGGSGGNTTATGNPGLTITAVDGGNGQTPAAGGLGGTVQGGYGRGGNGAVIQNVGGFITPTPATNGAPGRVRIYWQ